MSSQVSTTVQTGLTITNPLILYRTLLATRRIDPDPAQHRLALELQKLYFRLIDYSPQKEYASRLKTLKRVVKSSRQSNSDNEAAIPGHGLRRNPLFAKLFKGKEKRETLALTRVLTDHEQAIKLDSPKGMLLHGEVGCGKTMLLDLLADSLPNRKKRRWHFNTFMLETLGQLERFRIDRTRLSSSVDVEHSLLWLAKDLIEKSPILFLDEFQLPDRATSKILSNLFTTFFQLGGVLIASSNRLPDELAKASGVDYRPSGPVPVDFGRPKIASLPSNQEYAGFVSVLKARCEIYDLSGRDWRRREAEDIDETSAGVLEAVREEMVEDFIRRERLGYEQSFNQPSFQSSVDLETLRKGSTTGKATLPKFYLLNTSPPSAWEAAVTMALPSHVNSPAPWAATSIFVYGREVPVPRHFDGVCFWTFEELCGGSFGPADYITLASSFHTVILENVPILTIIQKNEARRLITLLDALYEARCKLIMRAETGPDDLFFPETKVMDGSYITAKDHESSNDANDNDAVYPETLSEIYQDQTSPFRPNISTYSDSSRVGYDPDEDSDFGLVPGKGNEIGRQVDFGMTSSFTGEDEKFAYKRARSRLWQLCSAGWNARSEPGWWNPVSIEVRRWEKSGRKMQPVLDVNRSSDVTMGDALQLDEPAGLQGRMREHIEENHTSPFREEREPPPKIDWTHAWGMIRWGKKAGAWGQGLEGLKDRKQSKQ